MANITAEMTAVEDALRAEFVHLESKFKGDGYAHSFQHLASGDQVVVTHERRGLILDADAATHPAWVEFKRVVDGADGLWFETGQFILDRLQAGAIGTVYYTKTHDEIVKAIADMEPEIVDLTSDFADGSFVQHDLRLRTQTTNGGRYHSVEFVPNRRVKLVLPDSDRGLRGLDVGILRLELDVIYDVMAYLARAAREGCDQLTVARELVHAVNESKAVQA